MDAGYLPPETRIGAASHSGRPATSVIEAVIGMPRSDPLDRAALVVLREHAGNGLVASDAAEVELEMRSVVESVRDVLRGAPLDPQPPRAAGRLGLLRALRGAVVRNWGEEDGNILPLLQAVETIEDHLVAWGDSETSAQVLHPFSRNLLREVAHFLRSPLGSIVMLTDTLLDGRSGPLTDLQRRQLDIIHRAALGVASITGDVLVLVNEDQRSLTNQRFEPSAVMEAAANVARPVALARGSEISVHSEIEGQRMGPAVGLGQALLGLMLRAALWTREGRVEVVAQPATESRVRFSITGIGARDPAGEDPRDLLRVFRFDAESGVSTLSADGLGMEAARSILDRIGSALTSAVQPGEVRFTFVVSLPRAD